MYFKEPQNTIQNLISTYIFDFEYYIINKSPSLFHNARFILAMYVLKV